MLANFGPPFPTRHISSTQMLFFLLIHYRLYCVPYFLHSHVLPPLFPLIMCPCFMMRRHAGGTPGNMWQPIIRRQYWDSQHFCCHYAMLIHTIAEHLATCDSPSSAYNSETAYFCSHYAMTDPHCFNNNWARLFLFIICSGWLVP